MFLSELYTVAMAWIDTNEELRFGQSLMIALKELDNDLYSKITGTEYDPFYKDIRIPRFEDKLNELKSK